MPDLKMLNSTKYLYKLTLIKCSYGATLLASSLSLSLALHVLVNFVTFAQS